jgi:transposase-like protein
MPWIRAIYRAETEELARARLDDVEAEWGRRYPAIGQAWRRNWDYVVPFFAFPPAIRKMIYTTDEIDKPFVVFREVLKRAPERPPTSLAQARARSLPWYRVSARATAWRRAGLEDGSLAAQPHRRSSFAALVRPAFGRRGCQWLTKCS